MRLVDLDPHFVGNGGEGVSDKDGNPVPYRPGVGISFLCPCAECTSQRTGDPDKDFHLRIFIHFENPLDGGPALEWASPRWTRTGDTFDTLCTQPSILSVKEKGGCGWHGYIGGPAGDRPGEVVTV